jgi:autotransporter-associated beta strand protein
LQAIAKENLYYATGVPSAANQFHFAARISTNYDLGAGVTDTIDTMGSVFGAVVTGSLTMGGGSQLNIVNGPLGSIAGGWFGFAGPITIGNGAVLNNGSLSPAQAGTTLALLGDIVQSGTGKIDGLAKRGEGLLILGGSSAAGFTGDLNVAGGVVLLNSNSALRLARKYFLPIESSDDFW